ncbi:MAG: anthranilate synthase component I [Candidatus Omnitrophica bacterium CG1_02_44_16]|nr:MAG: anthranilate synthase component I [Candidatus Omnitrophica bacterium CG1_02_44_16]PIY83407.1 MAG: anthranilate synthase component I [Candidatus Omnitrophica bacterium CG_4_10_14_0_8_um_filter_44_12]PIZ83310.1 MAG: anthranilate synthase component I [Candidatus Omnitrophica bacterium CG_4_10_14_0_2_um_filter_44_9]
MLYPDFKEFKKLSKKGNIIPVYKELPADLETPVSVFLKMDKNKEYSYLLESVESQQTIGRYSFIAVDPLLVFESKNKSVTFTRFLKGKKRKRSYQCLSSPLNELRSLLPGFKFVQVRGLPRFCGGLVGYLGYDMVRFFEAIPDKNIDELNAPDCVLMLSDTLVIFDHVNRKIKIVSNAILDSNAPLLLKKSYDAAVKKIEELVCSFRKPIRRLPEPKEAASKPEVASNMTKSAFKNAVLKAKEYIKRGDIIQVVLSQRFRTKLKNKPFDIYRSLRSINPSPYMFYMKLSGLTLIGSSPEMLVRCEDGLAETRPIAGTRPRGKDEEEDRKLALELLSDAKEKAEHLMLVDLGRNDIGRVSQYGSVRVDEFMQVEKYSHVMHMVSNVTGRLRKGKDCLDALISCFPAGTLSGAPKIRAMEIIDELEGARRGPYGGALGYFSFSGNLDSCIIIRTMVVKNSYVYMQAGAGIVADSKPQKEYDETVNKAKALLEAVRSAY